jgi:hypothetical protein
MGRSLGTYSRKQRREVLSESRMREICLSGSIEDLAQRGRFIETFMLDSWLEHLRQHERVTDADRNMQELVNRFQIDGAPKVTHYIAAT